jgi:hypothetical protein
MLSKFSSFDANTTENRIIVLTDDQPNAGATDPESCIVSNAHGHHH